MNLGRAIFSFLVGLFAAQFAFYYFNLPEIVAAHFNFDGEPDGWLGKTQFAFAELMIVLLIAAIFAVLPLIIAKTPDSRLNLPNKKYWLSKPRREEMFARIKISFERLASILLLLLLAVNQLIFRANVSRENISPTAISIILILFLTAIGVQMVKFINHFRKI